MNNALKLKKKYRKERDKLFQKLILNNDGFSFNHYHTRLVDKIVIELVKNILLTHPLSDFTLIAVGGYGRKDLSPKSDVDLLFIYKKLYKCFSISYFYKFNSFKYNFNLSASSIKQNLGY